MMRSEIAAVLLGLLVTAPLAGVTAPAPGIALTESLDFGPTRIQMIGAERTATLTIRNSNAAPASIQIRAMDWSQPQGIDQHTPSSVLLASPPQATLAPGEAQVIRLVADKLPAGAAERAFRLVIDQIPTEPAQSGAGVRTAIRALVPVFITGSTADRPRLRWRAVRSGDAVTLTAVNDGPAHERLIDARLSANGKPVGVPIEGYVLAGGTRSWTIAGVPAGTRSLAIASEGEFAQVRADVPIAP